MVKTITCFVKSRLPSVFLSLVLIVLLCLWYALLSPIKISILDLHYDATNKFVLLFVCLCLLGMNVAVFFISHKVKKILMAVLFLPVSIISMVLMFFLSMDLVRYFDENQDNDPRVIVERVRLDDGSEIVKHITRGSATRTRKIIVSHERKYISSIYIVTKLDVVAEHMKPRIRVLSRNRIQIYNAYTGAKKEYILN